MARMKGSAVSLVLGSGGARGLAHIGVIRWLQQQGCSIRSIAGSSMGALVGGIFAAGKLEVYADWVTALERSHVLRLLDPALGREGLFKGERIIAVLRELIGDCPIEALPLRYTAVATDLESGQEVWLREGQLFDAIRASIATPLVFTPFKHGTRTLLDGALVNPLPVAASLTEGTELTIAVNLGAPAEHLPAAPHVEHSAQEQARGRRIGVFVSKLRPGRPSGASSRGMLDVALASMQTMHDTITRLKLDTHPPDLMIEIPRNACGFHEFWRAEEMIALGFERAARALGADDTPPP